jgi:hypothetical protein
MAMTLGSVTNMFDQLGGMAHKWRRRAVRAEAAELYSALGEDAVGLVRQRIASTASYEDRRRLYQIHDEIARRLPQS